MVQIQATADIPKGEPKEIQSDTRMQDMMRQAYKLGPIYQLPMANGRRQIVLSGFSLIDDTCNETFYDKKVSPALKLTRAMTGSGLFTADTDDPNWRKAHAILMPGFGLNAMKDYLPMMIDVAQQLISKWEHLNPEDEIDVGDDMSRLTLDTIGECAFSYHFNSFGRHDLHPFVQSMVRQLSTIQALARQSPIERTLHIRERRQLSDDRNLIMTTADKLIQDRKAEGAEGLKKHDLLTDMLAGVDKKTNTKLDDINIRAQVVTFLIAGHETTSGLLSFTLYFLLHHPEVLTKAIAEVDRALGKDLTKMPTYEQIYKLPYITQILNESLRLAPPAPAFNRYPFQKRILGGKYEVTPDDMLTILIPMLHRDRSVWGDNAEVFDPEHFSPAEERRRPANAFKPFGTGQRSCIGRQFAMQEATLALAMILQRFWLYSPRIYQLKIREALTIKPANLFMKVRQRAQMDLFLTEVESETVVAATNGIATVSAITEETVTIEPTLTQPPTPVSTMLVLYGSNAGTSEDIAHRIASDGPKQGFTTSIGPLDNFVDKLPKAGAVTIVTASYNGQPPDNAADFCQWLHSDLPKDALKGVSYTVFGCGNHDWATTYQAIPKMIDSRMEELGATRVYKRGEGDAAGDFDGQFHNWYTPLWKGVAASLQIDPGVLKQSQTHEEDLPLYEVEIVRHPHPFPFENSFGALPMTVIVSQALDKHCYIPGVDHATQHIQISMPSDMAYQAGDHLGVVPSNLAEQVKRVASRFHFDQQTIVQLHKANGRKALAPIGEPISVYDLLANYVELQNVASREHIAKMAKYTSDPTEKQCLEQLSSSDAKDTDVYQREILDKHITLIDLLDIYPSCTLPFHLYLECLTPLRPRYYSISSSPLVKHDQCSITVSVIDDPAKSGRGMFKGVCSNYLNQQQPGNIIYTFIQNTSGSFHPPHDSRTPLIMVAAGTGIAPFRGFLQEHSVLKKHNVQIGPSLLFFGCRHPQADYLYQDELEQFEKDGVTKVYTAFSRLDPQKKVFVQDKILEKKDEVWSLLQAGAIVYVCGDANRMVPGVYNSFVQLIQDKTGKSAQESKDDLDALVAQRRYIVDIWGTT